MTLELITIIAVLMFFDNFLTQKCMKLYRKLHPKDKKWYEREKGFASKIFYKKSGFKKGYYLSYIKLLIVLLALYVSELFVKDIAEKFELILIGAFITVNLFHIWYIRDFKKELKNQKLKKWSV